ncbi:energy-coupling factor transporter ATPase [Clostridium chromiireducens]|uniref:Energy-coupling factor transporter ATP-binding protein EcfA1 n=1 Tax=Clostridium chromiireducens TaxID=225345 RepID=A0A1V4J2F3_9CLOT|nr:energy-coupling factor transporter ATPase [Clostridium chromiireducens]MVX62820.1 energy-coupling factor transporter ATPase [Clostridium chromiireducens]OPJ66185.1 energy-coupling factor transporter ATP-binding protein EcfA1 [Clostridium chromiireducens]
MSDEMIKCTNVSFKYIKDSEGIKEEKYAVNGVNLEVKKGEFLVVLGHNGSGKSTMAKHMNALLVPTEGTVVVDNLDTSDPQNVWSIRSKAGMVFQNPDNQLVATIVEEDVAFGPENLGIEPLEIRKRVDESLEKVGMSKYKRHAPHLLSGGQKQRIAIAGILAIQPKCIIFDEPTAMLDPSGRREVLKTIKDLNKKHGITIVLITHYMDEAAQADRIIVMDGGKIKMEGTPRDIFPQVERMKKIGLDVPQVTELAYELKKSGIYINEKILNVDEMVNALCQLK